MHAITRATSVAMFVTLALVLAAGAAEPPKPEAPADLDKLVGQSVDLSPWAYAWRADREVQEKPEAYFIPRRLKRLDTVYRSLESRLTEQERSKSNNKELLGFLPAPKGGLQSALLWLAPVPTERIELRWPEGSAVPPVEAIEVHVYPAKAGWFGFVGDEVLPAPQVSPDGRTWSYINEHRDPVTRKPRDTDMVAVFFDPTMRTHASLLRGREHGPAVTPGQLEKKSLLWRKILKDDMPRNDNEVSASDKEIIRKWIETGAKSNRVARKVTT